MEYICGMDLLERGPALLELSRLLSEAREGHGRLVFVGGEAGIGKTSLVRRFAGMVGDRTPVLMGGCDPLSTPRPLAPLIDIADRFPGSGISLAAGKDQIFRETLSALTSATNAVIIVFEDVHWADDATLDLVRVIGRRIHDCRALLIATYRDDETGHRHPLRQVLGDTATAPGVRRLTIAPLSLASVQAMTAGTALRAQDLFRQTGGNPFFVTEILATGRNEIPGTVRDAVLSRVSRLSAEARAVLEASSVIGFRIEPWLLNTVAPGSSSALEENLHSGVLTTDGPSYSFRHELARVAVLDSILPHSRLDLNRRVLDALLTLPPEQQDAARIAHHADEAGDGAVVVRYAPDAARRASRLSAHREAMAQYQRALRYKDRLPEEECARVLAEYAHECAATDDYDTAVASAREAHSHWRRIGDRFNEGAILGFISGCLLSTARVDEARAASVEAITLLERFPPSPELAESYARRSRISTSDRDLDEGVRWSEKALEIARSINDVRNQSIALNRLGSARLAQNDEGEQVLLIALQLAHDASLPVEAVGAYISLATILIERREFTRAETYLNEGLAYAEEHQLDGFLTPSLGLLALLKMYTGRWSEVEDAAARVLGRPRVNIISRMYSLNAIGKLYARRGDPRSSGVIDELRTASAQTPMFRYHAPMLAADAEAAWLSGDTSRAGKTASLLLDLALEKRHPWLAGEALVILSRIGERPPPPDWIALPYALELKHEWRAAAHKWRDHGCPYEAADVLAQSADADDLIGALAEFDRLEAAPAAMRVRKRLREMGIRGIPRGPRESTRSNEAGLTRREIEIVQLLSEGLTNSQIAERVFLSPKTVDHHVSNVLSKLGIHTRSHVGREAARLGLLQNGEPKAGK
jgi:DNA-binding CsgD family transcriptional regulator/tetratricopeptide (TPR) repeat protein